MNDLKFTLPKNTIFYQLEKAIKSYRKTAQQHLNKAGSNLTVDQLILLLEIAKDPTLSQMELSNLLFKDMAAITRMIELLEQKGYLTKKNNKMDRRKKDLSLTHEGAQTVNELVPVIKIYRKDATRGFTKDELRTLLHLLKKLIKNCSPMDTTEPHSET